jgi:hypothetical protein
MENTQMRTSGEQANPKAEGYQGKRPWTPPTLRILDTCTRTLAGSIIPSSDGTLFS